MCILQFGHDALEVIVYSRFGTGAWIAKAVWISSPLFYKAVLANTWTFQAWTNRTESDGVTYASLAWGNSTYTTGLSGLVYSAGTQFDWMSYHLSSGDIFNFAMTPYTYLIGNAVYAVLGFGLLGTFYVRYKNAGVVLVLLVLFGGAGGFANLLFGDWVMGVVWLLATFGFAALFWKVFR